MQCIVQLLFRLSPLASRVPSLLSTYRKNDIANWTFSKVNYPFFPILLAFNFKPSLCFLRNLHYQQIPHFCQIILLAFCLDFVLSSWFIRTLLSVSSSSVSASTAASTSRSMQSHLSHLHTVLFQSFLWISLSFSPQCFSGFIVSGCLDRI